MELDPKTEAYVIDATEPAASVDLRREARVAFRALLHVVYPACALHNADFRELEKLHELE